MNLSQLYARGKLFASFQYHRAFNKHAPLVSLLLLTARCNFSCTSCYVEHRGEFPDLPVETWKKIIMDLKSRGNKLIFLMGGEPLLYAGFSELVDFIKSQGLQCHVITNGALIRKHIGTLKKVDLVETSLDGAEKGNDANRGIGTFKLIDAGMHALKENKIPFRIKCVLTQANVGDVQWMLDYASQFDVYTDFTIPIESTNPKYDCSVPITKNQLIDVFKQILELSDKYKITTSKKGINHILNYPYDFDKIVNKTDESHTSVYPHECPFGRFIIFVDARGNIYPCSPLWGNFLRDIPVFTPKNIFKDGIDDALKNAQNLPCWICIHEGGVEWVEMSSFRGLIHALKFTLNQMK